MQKGERGQNNCNHYTAAWAKSQNCASVGCIQKWERVLGSLPKLDKSLAENSRTKHNHAVKSRTRPPHSRARQALFELPNATFDAPRANRKTIYSELGILHPTDVFAEIR